MSHVTIPCVSTTETAARASGHGTHSQPCRSRRRTKPVHTSDMKPQRSVSLVEEYPTRVSARFASRCRPRDRREGGRATSVVSDS